MTKKILIDASHAEETRVVVLDGSRLEDFDVETASRKQIKGNIYLAKVIRVEPSLQAAFVEYGGNRHGFLAFGEIHPDYYQIPVADRQKLLAMAAEAAREEAAEEAEEAGEAGSGEAGGIPVATADAVAPEPEVIEVPLEREAAQSLAIKPIDIIAMPPPDAAAAPEIPAEEPAEGDALVADQAPVADGDRTREDGEAAAMVESEVEEVPAEELPPPESYGGEGDDAAEARERRQRQRFLRSYKIQEVIHRRQIMLVQVVKEERGSKGAALTTYLSLAGRFSVLMPNSPTGGGVSRKITSLADRRRLKEAVAELDIPDGMGLIVRTAGANRPKQEIRRDCEYLLRLWDDIRDRTLQSIAPALIYEEASLIKRTIRDVYTRDVEAIYVDGEEGYRAARDFMRMLMPAQSRKVQQWQEGQPLFAKFQVEAQLDAMLNPIVQLRSGGYIVINQTEALVAIDVNSGRSTRERSIEDTAVRTNLEAAEEAARQLRMRDLAGLIVIDFIDMESRKNNGLVERRLKESLKNDRARIQVGSISHFGLMEMSRQRLRPSLAEAALVTCPHCNGMGHVRSPESAALHILRAIEDEGAKLRSGEIVVSLPPEVALYLFNHKRDRLAAIENRYGMRVVFNGDAALSVANFRIERTKPRAVPEARPIEPTPPEPEAEFEEEEEDETAGEAPAEEARGAEGEDGERRRRRRRRRGRRRGEGGAELPAPEAKPADEGGETGWTGDLPSDMDLVIAAAMGGAAMAEAPVAAGATPPENAPGETLAEPGEAAGMPAETAAEPAKPEKPARRPRTRRPRAAKSEAAAPAPAEPVYAEIADIFEAAERADEAQRVAVHLQVEPDAAPEAGSEPVAHAVIEPRPQAPEPAAPEPAMAEPGALPPVQPTLVDSAAPAERKRGWWRR